MKFINQIEPWFDESEKNAVIEYLDTKPWLTEFRKTREFESMIAEYTGAKYCCIMMNGTMTLYSALLALGVGSGDEVICPDYTMVASANAIWMTGAKVIFCDIEKESLCLDFEKLKEKVNKKTKAIMLVTINGRYPSKYSEIIDYCKRNNIHVVEDAAQSLGSFYKGKHLGRFGDIGSFSFSTPKVITTGQGGAVITDNEELYIELKMIKDFGRSKGGSDFYETMGFNFKFTDLQAVIGVEQMKKLQWRVRRKKEIYKLYFDLLKGIKKIEFIPTNLEDTSPWFIDALVEQRDELQKYLKENNIGTREFYPPLHSQPVYNLEGSFPVTEEISKKGLWLPSSSFLEDEQIEYVCEKINVFFKRREI